MNEKPEGLSVNGDASMVAADLVGQILEQLKTECERLLADIPNLEDGMQRLLFDVMLDVSEHLEELAKARDAIRADVAIFGSEYGRKTLFYDDGALMPADDAHLEIDGSEEECSKHCPCLVCPNFCGCGSNGRDTDDDDEDDDDDSDRC